MRAQAGVTYRRLFHVQLQVKPAGSRAQHRLHCGSDFRADPVAGENKEAHGYLRPNCGWPSSLFLRQRKEPRKQCLEASKGIRPHCSL
jgi:hypothetical protein